MKERKCARCGMTNHMALFCQKEATVSAVAGTKRKAESEAVPATPAKTAKVAAFTRDDLFENDSVRFEELN
jgi:hypothetical protein